MYEVYFVGRLLEELSRADQAQDPAERSIHLQACRYYRELLATWHEGLLPALPDETASTGT